MDQAEAPEGQMENTGLVLGGVGEEGEGLDGDGPNSGGSEGRKGRRRPPAISMSTTSILAGKGGGGGGGGGGRRSSKHISNMPTNSDRQTENSTPRHVPTVGATGGEEAVTALLLHDLEEAAHRSRVGGVRESISATAPGELANAAGRPDNVAYYRRRGARPQQAQLVWGVMSPGKSTISLLEGGVERKCHSIDEFIQGVRNLESPPESPLKEGGNGDAQAPRGGRSPAGVAGGIFGGFGIDAAAAGGGGIGRTTSTPRPSTSPSTSPLHSPTTSPDSDLGSTPRVILGAPHAHARTGSGGSDTAQGGGGLR